MEESHSFVPLLIVVVLAFLVPLVLSRFKRLSIPVVVGEILVGVVIGKSGLGLIGHDSMLEMLSLLGFAYLMFLSGLEVDFEAVLPQAGTMRGSWRERLSNPLSLGLLIFALTVVIALIGGWLLHGLDTADDPWLMALILSTTSLGVVVPVLKERDLLSQPYGQALLVTAVIADFASMILVSIYVIVNAHGLTFEVLLVLLLFGAFLTAYRLARLARRRFPGLDFLQNLSQATSQIDVRGAFAIGLVFIALAQGLGVEMILGAFLGGALISLLADRGASDLHHRLDVIGYAFFIPIFFIMVGVNLDLYAVFESPRTLLLVPVILVLAYAVKMIAALLFRIKFSWRETLAGGVLLSSHLSLEIAISAIALNLGVIDEATNSVIILMAIVTCTFSPLIFNRIVPLMRVDQHKFVIVGAGRSARLLAKRILGHGEEVVVIEQQANRVAAAQEMELPLVEADPLDPNTWEALEPDRIEAVAVLLPEDEKNLQVCRLLRGEICLQRVISRVHDATGMDPFTQLDVPVINPSLSPVVELEYLLLFPSVSSLMTDLDDEHDIAEVRLGCADLTGKPLQELELPEGAFIVLIRREGDVIYPRGHTVLQIGDHLTLMGPQDVVRELSRRCE
jgi:Kef-type K+ transport system membrane component KefB/Trk K+ transport system NAD-binding subunit